MSTQLQHREVTTADESQAPQGKRILMLTHEFPPFRGGIATYCAELARAAHELGHRIVVLAPSHGADNSRADRETYPFQIVRYMAGTYSYRNLPAVLLRTLRAPRQNDWDILHAADPSYLMALAALNRFVRIPHIATAYGTELLGLSQSRQARLLGATSLFRYSTRVCAISDFTRTLVEESSAQHRMPPIEVTPLGVSLEWFASVSSSSIRTRFGIAADQTIMLTVARLDERKGHRGVLRAIGMLPEEVRRRLTYCIVGEGGSPGYTDELKHLVAVSGGQVIFTGGVDSETLRQLYAEASFFCMPGEPHPKRVEGFGLVYLEAAAQGLPSIASRLGAVPEVVRHGETGLIVTPGDTTELAGAISRLVQDDSLRAALGQNARTRAAQYTWRRCAELTYGD